MRPHLVRGFGQPRERAFSSDGVVEVTSPFVDVLADDLQAGRVECPPIGFVAQRHGIAPVSVSFHVALCSGVVNRKRFTWLERSRHPAVCAPSNAAGAGEQRDTRKVGPEMSTPDYDFHRAVHWNPALGMGLFEIPSVNDRYSSGYLSQQTVFETWVKNGKPYAIVPAATPSAYSGRSYGLTDREGAWSCRYC